MQVFWLCPSWHQIYFFTGFEAAIWHLTCFASPLWPALKCSSTSTRNVPCLALPIFVQCQHHQTTADQKTQSPHASHPEPTNGWRPVLDHCATSGLCDTLQTQPCLCSLTFLLICGFRQSNAIINKDHKQVTAFIPLKFMVQKRSFSGWQHWLLFGGSFPQSLATNLMVTELNAHQWSSVLGQ